MRTAKYSLEGKPQQSLRSRKTSLTHQMEINFTLPIYPTTTITCRSPTPEFPNINSMYGATRAETTTSCILFFLNSYFGIGRSSFAEYKLNFPTVHWHLKFWRLSKSQ
ncbi:hypothetical protein M758_4G051000 [Ceratodon purpureus]|nr:hypothetical protein M758_4G051000 [Ceratodon purpureus]